MFTNFKILWHIAGGPPKAGSGKGPEACQDHGKSVILLLPSTPGWPGDTMGCLNPQERVCLEMIGTREEEGSAKDKVEKWEEDHFVSKGENKLAKKPRRSNPRLSS